MGGQLGKHPPCVATGALPQGPSGRETTPAEYPHGKRRQSSQEADGFNFLGGRPSSWSIKDAPSCHYRAFW